MAVARASSSGAWTVRAGGDGLVPTAKVPAVGLPFDEACGGSWGGAAGAEHGVTAGWACAGRGGPITTRYAAVATAAILKIVVRGRGIQTPASAKAVRTRREAN